jgi:hypothetical protein
MCPGDSYIIRLENEKILKKKHYDLKELGDETDRLAGMLYIVIKKPLLCGMIIFYFIGPHLVFNLGRNRFPRAFEFL